MVEAFLFAFQAPMIRFKELINSNFQLSEAQQRVFCVEGHQFQFLIEFKVKQV